MFLYNSLFLLLSPAQATNTVRQLIVHLCIGIQSLLATIAL
jgi:hypothetical protein